MNNFINFSYGLFDYKVGFLIVVEGDKVFFEDNLLRLLKNNVFFFINVKIRNRYIRVLQSSVTNG